MTLKREQKIQMIVIAAQKKHAYIPPKPLGINAHALNNLGNTVFLKIALMDRSGELAQ